MIDYLQIRWVDGEAYVRLDHTVQLVVEAQNEVARLFQQRQEQVAMKEQELRRDQAIAMQAHQSGLVAGDAIGSRHPIGLNGNQIAQQEAAQARNYRL